MIKKRRPVLAAILSLIAPGVGHVYAGNAKKGLSLIGIEFLVPFLIGIAGLLSTFYGFAALIVFIIGFYIYVIVSSVRLAYKNKEYHLKAYYRWYWYLALIVAIAVLANVLIPIRGSVFGYETYHIPAKSMEPTLQVGDFITVDTRYSQPRVGDVVVFLYPKDRTIRYVKRVAALGNDRVSIENGSVIRNGEVVISLSVPESRRQNEYSISMKERHIPENEIFLLGDWRDNSNDGRFWGTVPITDVIGKVTYIWYSKDVSKIGMRVE
jgi:signal peptidase I